MALPLIRLNCSGSRPGIGHAHVVGQLAVVDLGNQHLLEALEHRAEVLRKRVEPAQVHVPDLLALGAEPGGGAADRAVGAAPGEEQQVAGGLAVHDDVGDVLDDVADLLGAGLHHLLVVHAVVGDHARHGVLLEAADAVFEAGRARDRPGADELGVAQVRHVLPVVVGRGLVLDLEGLHLTLLGDAERLGAEAKVPVGEHEHRGHPLDGDLEPLQRRVEAVGRAARRDDRHGRLAVAAEERDVEVGLLGLGGHARGGAAALHVDDDQRQLGDDREAQHLRLERESRAGGGGHAQGAAEGGADGGADAGDLVLGLVGHDPHVLEVGGVLEDLGGRGDGVASQEDLAAGELGHGGQREGRGAVAGHVPVGSRRQLGRRHPVLGDEELGGLAEGVTGLEHLDVGLGDLRLLLELGPDVLELRLGRAAVEPVHHAQREVVPAAGHVLVGEPRPGQRGLGELVHVDRDDLVVLLQGVVVERVGLVAGLLEVALGVGPAVGDEDAAGPEVLEVGLQGGRVHGHEDVGLVTRGEDVPGAEVDLVARDAGQRARGGANLGGEVGEGGQVVAGDGGRSGELRADQLHAVAGVADEADGDAFDLLDRPGLSSVGLHVVLRLLDGGPSREGPWRGGIVLAGYQGG